MKISKLEPRKIFLIDGLGAIVTSVSMFLLLAPLHSYIGLYREHLLTFGSIAAVLGVYSFSIFVGFRHPKALFLYLIASGNAAYVVYTSMVLLEQLAEVNIWGWLYFTGELTILLVLILIEWSTAKRVARQS